ncbi:MAG: SURF1 family protein [Alphaproteobacteria bacterium]|nr:MAG: SURF1 family protein [Alphaproteobacteria bacterium]
MSRSPFWHWFDAGLWGLAFICVLALASIQLSQAGRYVMPPEDRQRWQEPPLRHWPGGLEVGEWADWVGRRVQMTGFYRFNRDFFLGAQIRDGIPGTHLITPLILGDGSAVLVDRGWIPDAMKDPARRAALPRPLGPQLVEGVLRLPPQAAPDAPQGGRDNPHWLTIDRTVMKEWLCGSPTVPLLVQPATRVDAYGPEFRAWVHMAVAGALYALALALMGVRLWTNRRRKRQSHA